MLFKETLIFDPKKKKKHLSYKNVSVADLKWMILFKDKVIDFNY